MSLEHIFRRVCEEKIKEVICMVLEISVVRIESNHGSKYYIISSL